jgi:transcription antitermination factor NusG
MSFWGVVQVQPMCERRALLHLGWQGFDTYAPRERTTHITRGRKVTSSRLLFSRYVFVWMAEHWYRLFATAGISRLLMTGNEPSKLPDGLVEQLRSRERNGLIQLPKHRFRIGQHVEVGGGLFVGAKGLYQGMTSRQREVVLLDTLGCKVELASGLLR